MYPRFLDPLDANQEGLPDYWGIETFFYENISFNMSSIRKDYPTTGVLRLLTAKDGIDEGKASDQEGLPDYWGIETYLHDLLQYIPTISYQEGLPDYWGIETF